MKKIIILAALVFAAAISFAKTKTTPAKTDTVKTAKAPVKAQYTENPKMIIHFDIEAQEAVSLFQVAPAGVIPFLKTTQTPMNQLEGIQDYLKGIMAKMQKQMNDQVDADKARFLKADSLKALKTKK